MEAFETMDDISVESHDDKIIEVFKGILNSEVMPTHDLVPQENFNFIAAIKYDRKISGRGLKEAKEYVENLLAERKILKR